MSDGQIIGGSFDLTDLSVEYIKTVYLPGISINNVEDNWFREHLLNAVEFVRDETGVVVFDEEVQGELHDYNATDFMQFGFLRLNRGPLKEVKEVRASFPSSDILFTFPKEFIRADENGRQIHIVPSGGNLSQAMVAGGATYLPFIRDQTYLPMMFMVDYTAGWMAGRCPRRVVEAVCKKACIDILAQVGDLIYGPGVVNRSVSVDGLSQSESYVNNGQMGAVFTSRIAQYTKDLWGSTPGGDQDGLLWSIKKQYVGLQMVSV